MTARANDFSRPESERNKAKEVLYRLKHQKSDPYIIKLREKMKKATLNGDRNAVERLSDEAKKIDNDFRL